MEIEKNSALRLQLESYRQVKFRPWPILAWSINSTPSHNVLRVSLQNTLKSLIRNWWEGRVLTFGGNSERWYASSQACAERQAKDQSSLQPCLKAFERWLKLFAFATKQEVFYCSHLDDNCSQSSKRLSKYFIQYLKKKRENISPLTGLLKPPDRSSWFIAQGKLEIKYGGQRSNRKSCCINC